MPEKTRSLFSILAYGLYLTITVPIKRMFGSKPPVSSWSIRTEISVLFIRRMLDNSLQGCRDNEKKAARFANLSIKEPIEKVQGAGFKGVMIGPASCNVNDPIVLYMHGGGYSLCDSLTYVASIARLLNILRNRGKIVQVFSLEYTLAPEGKYPTQLKEAAAALRHLKTSFPSHPIYLMGDSAGGHLALSLLLEIQSRPDEITGIDGCILVSPWVNVQNSSIPNRNEPTDLVTSNQLIGHMERFVPKEMSLDDIRLSPGLAESFKGFPRMFVYYGGMEVFHDDIEPFVGRMKDQKVPLVVVKEEDAPHITPMMIPFFPAMAEKGLNSICDFICTVT